MMDNQTKHRSGPTSTQTVNMNTRKIRIVVELEILKDADEQDIMSECDYSFEHADIVETEILGEAD